MPLPAKPAIPPPIPGFVLPKIPAPPKVLIQPGRLRDVKIGAKTPQNPLGFDLSDDS